MKQMRRRYRRLAAVLSLAGVTGVLTAGSAQAASAYLSSREYAENSAGPADNRIVIEEPDFNPDTRTDYGTTVYPKRVNLKNTGTVPVYARVRLAFSDPRAEACTSFTNSEGTFPADELERHLPAGWVSGKAYGLGEYYYLTEPLAANETSADLIRSAMTVFSAETGLIDYEIYVRAESIQTESVTADGSVKEQTWNEAWEGSVI